jgi:hypothetical protein
LRYLNRNEEAARLVENVTKEKIKLQIAPDGSQPRELGRTKSLHYSSMNLKAFCLVAELGKPLGLDLWNYETEDGRSLKKAAEFLAHYAEGKKTWEWQEITGMENVLENQTKPMLSMVETLFGETIVDPQAECYKKLDFDEILRYPPTIVE